jgi:hypothetical protein
VRIGSHKILDFGLTAMENQTKCWIATAGHIWMKGYFVTLPLAVRRRLRGSPFNLCPACLVTEFLPRMERSYPRERALFAAIDVMEAKVRAEVDQDQTQIKYGQYPPDPHIRTPRKKNTLSKTKPQRK